MYWNSKWQCPQGHLIAGVAWDDSDQTRREAVAVVEKMIRDGVLKSACGLCGGEGAWEHVELTGESWGEVVRNVHIEQRRQDSIRDVHMRRN